MRFFEIVGAFRWLQCGNIGSFQGLDKKGYYLDFKVRAWLRVQQ